MSDAASPLHQHTWCPRPLPPLQLRGIGSTGVESLEHYLVRLADTCGVSPKSLAFCVAERASCSEVLKVSLRLVIGSSVRTSAFVDALEGLTGIPNLGCGTLSALRNVLEAGVSDCQTQWRRWCPVCYFRWNGDDSFEPLLWTIHHQNICDVHDVLMEDFCSVCKAQQHYFVPLESRRICFKCKYPLARNLAPIALSTEDKWVAGCVRGIVAVCGTSLLEPIPANNVRLLANGIADQIRSRSERAPFLDRALLLLKKAAIRGKLTMRTAINLCALQGVDAECLFQRPAEALGFRLFDFWRDFASLPMAPKQRLSRPYLALECVRQLCRRRGGALVPFAKIARLYRISRAEFAEVFSDAYVLYSRKLALSNDSFVSHHLVRAITVAIDEVSARLASGRKLRRADLVHCIVNRAAVDSVMARHALWGSCNWLSVTRAIDRQIYLGRTQQTVGFPFVPQTRVGIGIVRRTR